MNKMPPTSRLHFINRTSLPAKQKGISLLEVMIAAIVAIIALLGMALLELNILRSAHSSFHYTVSTIKANNLVDEIWLDLCNAAEDNGAYEKILTKWYKELEQEYSVTEDLPDDNFSYQMEIEINWLDQRINEEKNNQIRLSASFPEVCN